MGRESCLWVTLHLGAKRSHARCNPLVQQPQTVPVAPHNPQNTRENEALALVLQSGVPLSAMGWEQVCPWQEWLLSGTCSEGRADPWSKLPAKPHPAEN